jgi:hypothetical protein
VVLNPHVFNLTGQLESKLPEFPTLAATDDHVVCLQISQLKSRLPKHYTPLHLYIPAHHPDFIY